MGKYDPWDGFFASLEGSEVEMRIEELERNGGVTLPVSARRYPGWWLGSQPHSRWLAHGWRARPDLEKGSVTFTRRIEHPAAVALGRHHPARELPQGVVAPQAVPVSKADMLVMACSAPKVGRNAAARELYTGMLWKRRREYAERSGKPWFIVSPEYGLVAPDQRVAPHDRRLDAEPAVNRARWAKVTAGMVIARARELGATSVELHIDPPHPIELLETALAEGELTVTRPLAGLSRNDQIDWYDGKTITPARRSTRWGSVAEPPARATGGWARQIGDLYGSGALGATWSTRPEVVHYPDTDPASGRRWLTFVTAIGRASDDEPLWEAAGSAWKASPWIFDPAQVVRRSLIELSGTLHGLGLGARHVHMEDAAAWRAIAEALISPECPQAVSAAIAGEEVDAAELLSSLHVVSTHGMPLFPQLGGAAVGPLWVTMLVYPGGAAVTGLDAVPMIVDVNIQRVTEMLGLVEHRNLDRQHRNEIQEIWFREVRLAEKFGAPGALDGTAAGLVPAVWLLGSVGCAACEQKGEKIALAPICRECSLARLVH